MAIETGNSNPQGWALKYGGKNKIDGKSNAKIREWTNFSEGSGWMSSTDSLPRLWGVYGKSKQI
jgi:hypothetical protein